MTVLLSVAVAMLAQTAPPLPPTPPTSTATPAPRVSLPNPVAAVDVLAAFVTHCESAEGYPASATAFVRGQFEARKGGDELSTLLDESLALLSPEFKAGLDAAMAGEHDAAADAFTKLSDSPDPYIAVNSTFFAAQSLVARERVRDLHPLLQSLFDKNKNLTQFTTHGDHLLFLLAYSQAHLLEYDQAMNTLEHFLANYPAAPERYRSTAQQMLTELSRREPGMLGDVHDLMNYSRRELTLGKTDEDVINKQDEAVKLLEKLIQDAEEKEKKQGQGKSGKNSKNKKKGGSKQPQQSQQPRARSEMTPGGAQERELSRANTAKPGDMWGRMPAKERDQILQALQKQFPSQYRSLLEQYYKQIAKDSPRQ